MALSPPPLVFDSDSPSVRKAAKCRSYRRLPMASSVAAPRARSWSPDVGGSAPLGEADQHELAALVLSAFDELAQMEREHADALHEIEDSALAEMLRLLEGAQQQVSDIWAHTVDEDPTELAPLTPLGR